MTTPVVLYGTQSNGETLPVQVDATGRLVAEGLEGPPGPPGPEGPEGPGGSIDLPPDPEEGQALGWLNGELGWIDLYNPPIIYPAQLLNGIRENPGGSGFRDTQGNLVDPVNGWDNAARELSNWDAIPSGYPYMGVTTQYGWGDLKINFDLQGALGKVFTVKTYMYAQKTKSEGQVMELYLNSSSTSSNLSVIRSSSSLTLTGQPPGWYGLELTAQWLCNRDEYQNINVDLNGYTVNSGTNQQYVVCHYWALEDAGKVALERQLALEKEIAQRQS